MACNLAGQEGGGGGGRREFLLIDLYTSLFPCPLVSSLYLLQNMITGSHELCLLGYQLQILPIVA